MTNEQAETRNCGCGATPGDLHRPGCDVERCPRCKHQLIGCDCIYEVNGMDPDTLDVSHPEIYEGGPTDKMVKKWNAEWDSKRLPWTGYWPGDLECRALGYYCRDLWADTGEPVVGSYDPVAHEKRGIRFHIRCAAEDLGAHEDLNRWGREGCPEVP